MVVLWDSIKCNEKMEGELNLKRLFFNYKCSSSKQLFLTAGHQLHRVTEVFRQEINKWNFFLAKRSHYIMAVFLPSACGAIRNWQVFKTVRLFLDEGHSIKLGSHCCVFHINQAVAVCSKWRITSASLQITYLTQTWHISISRDILVTHYHSINHLATPIVADLKNKATPFTICSLQNP